MNFLRLSQAPFNILFGTAIGDALGVPVEFCSRQSLKENPVTGMRALGTHKQPAGTWSDDTALTLCTASCIANSFDINVLAQNFISWYRNGLWSARGAVFDIGIATSKAIERLEAGISPLQSGCASEPDNGNGSLMRIAPMALLLFNKPQQQRYTITSQVSSITHAHIRSVTACIYFVELLRLIMNDTSMDEAYETLSTVMPPHLIQFGVPQKEINAFHNFFQHDIRLLSESEIQSTGYVLHTLEAAVWSVLTSDSFEQAVLKAVNLGGDTDTTAAVAGALAATYWGLESIPSEWRQIIPLHDAIADLSNTIAQNLDLTFEP